MPSGSRRPVRSDNAFGLTAKTMRISKEALLSGLIIVAYVIILVVGLVARSHAAASIQI
jgi:hypothetical protein